MKTRQSYHTIEDFLISHPLTVDVEVEDEWSGSFPVKGVEMAATILFAELPDYYRLSFSLQTNEMLVYVNNFLAWINKAVETLGCCVLHRYLDHAVMLVFSAKFGSNDPFRDALCTARWMGENDVLRFSPCIGIASGVVTAGFTGIPKQYSAAVFGKPVVLAAAYAGAKPKGDYAMRITVADEEWGEKTIEEVFPPVEYDDPEQGRIKQPRTWELGRRRDIDLALAGRLSVRDIASFIHWMPEHSAEKKAGTWFDEIKRQGYYRDPFD